MKEFAKALEKARTMEDLVRISKQFKAKDRSPQTLARAMDRIVDEMIAKQGK
jgi:hypothetical protein